MFALLGCKKDNLHTDTQKLIVQFIFMQFDTILP